MTTEYNASEIDRLVREGRDAIDRRGECAGPLTTFDRERDTSTVGIICRDNWDDVIRWLACCERVFPQALAALSAAKAEVERYRAALTKISAIRDSIVGMQGFNFSEHAYPLVAALDEVGFKGAGYEIASKNLGTLIEQRDAAEAERIVFRGQVERLTKENGEQWARIQNLLEGQAQACSANLAADAEIGRLSARVRELELTEEEREALEFARSCVGAEYERAVAEADEGCEPSPFWTERALIVLDRLVKGGR